MPTIPSASVAISATAGALAGGTGYCVVMGCAGTNADSVPRVFSSATDIVAEHGYCPAADYAALHIEATGKPVIFVALPVTTAGVLGREDTSGWTGGSVVSVAAGSAGYLEETDLILTCTTGGTRGTTGIKLTLSLDGGVTEKVVNLGTATSYTVPYVGIVISFGAGTMVAGDVYTCTTTAPMWGSTAISTAETALLAQQKLSRTWLVVGDVANATFAGYVATSIGAYETAGKRFALARAQVSDRTPLAEMSRVTARMTGTPTITFAEVGSGSDTITRSAGSFITDGFSVGDIITVSGAVATTGYNNVTAAVTGVAATVLTLGGAAADDLINEGPISGVSIVGSHALTFTTTTATRTGGSWLDDGFAVGDSVTFGSTSLNNITVTITVLTATVMTFASGGTAEVIGTRTATCVKGQTMAAYVAAQDAAFSSVDAKKRLSLGIGRLRKQSPITGWEFRRPVQWAASIREYQHDVHHPTWTKEDGPLDGWSMLDTNDNIVEFDERTNGGAIAARFTCARTWGNGPNGAFIAFDMTRETEGSTLQLTHNVEVANVFCTVVQAKTENLVGKTPQLDSDGHATGRDLGVLEESVNTDVKQALLRTFVPGEGPRASFAVWRASTDDDLRGPDATLTGVGELHVNGTIVHVSTLVAVS